MLLLLKEKKDLIQTIRSILKLFPEGVIIQLKDDNIQKYITKYANKSAREDILGIGIDEDLSVFHQHDFMKVKV